MSKLQDMLAVLGNPVIDISADTLNGCRNAVLYAWISASDEILYIGSSKMGLERPLSHSHYHFGAKLVTKGSRVLVWGFKAINQARDAEKFAIAACRPKVNKQSFRHLLESARRRGWKT